MTAVYAMDVSFYHSLGAYDFDARCEMLAQLGYDGVTLTLWSEEAWADVPKLAGVWERYGLEVVSVLVFADVSGPPDHVGNRRIVELCGSLTGCARIEICLWASDASFSPRPRGKRPSETTYDEAATLWLRQLLPIAERRGITLCLYPHVGFWMERIEDALRLCRAIDHPNLRMVFNGWHWYAVDGTDLSSGIANAALYLALANLCGTRRLNSHEMPATIEPLDDGELDNFAVLGELKAAGYCGPIGIQGYSVGGDVYAKLARSLKALREMEVRLAEHPTWARLRPAGSTMSTPRADPGTLLEAGRSDPG